MKHVPHAIQIKGISFDAASEDVPLSDIRASLLQLTGKLKNRGSESLIGCIHLSVQNLVVLPYPKFMLKFVHETS